MFKGKLPQTLWSEIQFLQTRSLHSTPALHQYKLGKVRNMKKGGTLSSMRICKVGNQKEILHALLKPFW